MSRSQNTPRESLTTKRLVIASNGTSVLENNSTGNLKISKGLALSGEATDYITQDSTAVKFAAGIVLSGQGSANAITQNSTAVAFPDGISLNSISAVLSGRKGPGHVVFVGNSTGNMLAVNTTGTTWKYLNVTSVLA